MHKEAANMNSENGVAFLINLLDETTLPKLNPEIINSKLEIQQTLVKNRALSPDIKKTYKEN